MRRERPRLVIIDDTLFMRQPPENMVAGIMSDRRERIERHVRMRDLNYHTFLDLADRLPHGPECRDAALLEYFRQLAPDPLADASGRSPRLPFEAFVREVKASLDDQTEEQLSEIGLTQQRYLERFVALVRNLVEAYNPARELDAGATTGRDRLAARMDSLRKAKSELLNHEDQAVTRLWNVLSPEQKLRIERPAPR